MPQTPHGINFAAHRRPEHYRIIVERTGAEVTPANEP